MPYTPGLHIVAEFSVPDPLLLNSYVPVKKCLDDLIAQHGLVNLGEVYHHFTPVGYTAVICLSESHISLHSWPEYNRIHLDVYLSNFLKNNDHITQHIYESLIHFFNADVIQQQTIRR